MDTFQQPQKKEVKIPENPNIIEEYVMAFLDALSNEDIIESIYFSEGIYHVSEAINTSPQMRKMVEVSHNLICYILSERGIFTSIVFKSQIFPEIPLEA